MSDTSKLDFYSFTGSSTQKSEAVAVQSDSGSAIDFIPKEISKEFANLNGLVIRYYNSPVLRINLFTEEFNVIKNLYLGSSKIEVIEENAFEPLSKLKWIDLGFNQVRSLPFQLFKRNPELLYINFWSNKIASINPNFCSGLSRIKLARFERNQCVNKKIRCEICSVTQSDLNSE